ncbi:ParB/RepB/Spo0J family partition protein [Oerskovia turbata]|uniref:ParB/RepB/Spo0J family partition protein n=1 Tax=Oerskovia turbata TaxID=1713 RepID=A0A4Q1KJP9_9CELL|nr:ParB/RepB/Spo0J family partition protein [Oerskovia turbata]RXR21735.1 ParB/RepB/Spo0J family partition protein [Oerskovia turbata]RXR29615.1 ParB/RepB/Spo0J family partition protein [Oerskovia turbata]TGJ95930.1 ParB/RepB/Spo0J family partition protein [Actinotalea fermentans ATCC 43279 = JCM 9966 = DSM 3133]
MSEKRRGLGRGLGALIPTSPERERPVDVFFPSAPRTAEGAQNANPEPGGVGVSGASAPVLTIERTGADSPASLLEIDEQDVAERAVTAHDAPNNGGDSPAEDATSEGRETADQVVVDVSRETGSTEIATPDSEQASTDLVPVPGATFAELPVELIRANSRQPRTVFDEGELDELVGSIKEIGVLQPVVVRRDPENPEGYELIMGERRWRATQAAGLDVIPAIIRETDDADLLRDALLENLHRSALNPLEEAAAYRQLLDDFGCTHEELGARISRSRSQISNMLRLLRLPPLVQRRVAAGVLSAGHARALLGLTDGAEIERLAQRIVSEGLSVRATEEIVALGGLDAKRPVERAPRPGQRSAAIDELASRLSDRFETRVKVDLGKNKGRLTVEFASVEDLNRILDLMAPQDPGLLRP